MSSVVNFRENFQYFKAKYFILHAQWRVQMGEGGAPLAQNFCEQADFSPV